MFSLWYFKKEIHNCNYFKSASYHIKNKRYLRNITHIWRGYPCGKIPYAMMLVGLGIIISLAILLVNGFDQIKFDSNLIINFVIPPLIFEAMMRIDYKDFTRVKVSVALVTSLPQSELKNSLETITFGVVLLSLVIQYIVLSKYIKRVNEKFGDSIKI